MARKQGRWGERAFATAVSDYEPGATCNDSSEDEHGWDHVVHFDAVPVPGLPADIAPTTPAVFVQTKTAANANDLTVTVKLSTALAFTRSDNPFFIVLVHRQDDGSPRLHAVHWWAPLMERALERARLLWSQDVDESTFHKRTISVRMTDADARSAHDLVGWLKATVDGLGRDYAGAKVALRNSLGFGDDAFGGSVQFGEFASFEELVDHMLGLTERISATSVTLVQRRFGIEFPFPLPPGKPDFVRMHAHPVARCEVKVRGPDGTSFVVEGDVICAAGVPEEYQKFRIRTPMFDLFWRPKGGASQFRATFDSAREVSPAELEKVARFFSWAGGSIDFVASINGDRFFAGDAVLEAQPDSGSWASLVAPLGTLAMIAEARRSEGPVVSIEQLRPFKWLDLLHSMIAATETTASAPTPFDPEGIDHGVGFGVLTAGAWVFAALVRFPVLPAAPIEGTNILRFGKPTVLETYTFPAGQSEKFDMLRLDYERFATRPGALAMNNMPLALSGEGDVPT